MKQNTPNLSEWEICPPGLLHETATVREPSWWPSVLLAVASVVAIIAILFQLQPVPEPAPVTSQACVMTRQVMVDYVRGEIKDCGTRKRIGCHIYHCPDCRKVYCQTKRSTNDGQPDTLVNPRLPCECP